MSETGIYIRVGNDNVLLEDLNEIERTIWLQSLSENGLIRTVNRCCDVIEDFIVNYQHLQQENQQLKSVLDEIREYINHEWFKRGQLGIIDKSFQEWQLKDILQILDKVKE